MLRGAARHRLDGFNRPPNVINTTNKELKKQRTGRKMEEWTHEYEDR
jgi:hypothetical protein